MSTMTSTALTASRQRDDRPIKRKKDQRTEIWSNLLRQTREAQARSRTQAIQYRDILVCGGAPEDQRSFIQSLARSPPAGPPGRNQRDERKVRPKGEVTLSNRFAYGYGHVSLFSPPHTTAAGIGGEAEEVARVGVHTVPEAEQVYEETLRRLLRPSKQESNDGTGDEDSDVMMPDGEQEESRRPSVVLLLSWKAPWKFLHLLKRWVQLLARALLPPNSPTEDPLDVLKEYKLGLTVVAQHVEAQEALEREGYKEESFDFINQCLRTCLLPIEAGVLYMHSAPPPPPGAPATARGIGSGTLSQPLTEVQKVLYSSLGLDLAALSPRPTSSGGNATPSTPAPGAAKKDDFQPRHNVVDRMAIVVPSGWDSVGKIRLLSETFSPEGVMENWIADLNKSSFQAPPSQQQGHEIDQSGKEAGEVAEANANPGAEQYTYESTGTSSPAPPASPFPDEPPMSPSKVPKSAIAVYENTIEDPNAHKAPQPPRIEVSTKPNQDFLAEMRVQLQLLEQRDAERAKTNPTSVSTTGVGVSGGRGTGGASGESTGALNELGDVSFNVGGVNYNAEVAIDRLKRTVHPSSAVDGPGISSSAAATPRTGTPRPPRRVALDSDDAKAGGPRETSSTPSVPTPSTGSKGGDVPLDKLEEYFASLAKRGGGNSALSTPSKAPGAGH